MSAGDMRDYRWYRSLGWSVPDALAAVRNPMPF